MNLLNGYINKYFFNNWRKNICCLNFAYYLSIIIMIVYQKLKMELKFHAQNFVFNENDCWLSILNMIIMIMTILIMIIDDYSLIHI